MSRQRPGGMLDREQVVLTRVCSLFMPDGYLSLHFEGGGMLVIRTLKWTLPPSVRRVAEALERDVGAPLQRIGDIEIRGFYGPELRLHIRQLLEAGHFPRNLPVGPSGPGTPRTVREAICDLCSDYGADLEYTQPGGPMIRAVHHACLDIWDEERFRVDPRGD